MERKEVKQKENKQKEGKPSKLKQTIIGCIICLGVIAVIFAVIWKPVKKLKNRKAPSQTMYVPDAQLEKASFDEVCLPIFSVESGFYEERFELEITASAGAIYYTLDGSDPAGNENAMLYKKPLSIYDNTSAANRISAETDIALSYYDAPDYPVDKGITVRAVVKDEAGNYGQTVTKSYFVGKSKQYYQNLKVISLVTNPYNLFDPDEGIYVIGNSYYDWQNSADFDPDMEEWRLENPTNYNQSGREWERPATIHIFEGGTLVYEQDVGIRLSGRVSRSNAQKSIRLYAREEYGDKKLRYEFFEGLNDISGKPIKKFDKVTLRNAGNDTTSAFFRDELVQSLCEDRAVGIQAEEPCILFIDGEFWGMYHMKERIEDHYFASHYNIDKSNVTYIKCTEAEGSKEIKKEYEDFYRWAMESDLSVRENYEKVDGNIYCDGRWRFVLYDTEYSANLYNQEVTSPEYNSFENINSENNWVNIGALFLRLLENETFSNEFYANYLEIMENNFASERVNKWIDDYIGDYSLAVVETIKRFTGNCDIEHYEKQVRSVREFYNERPEYARQYLDALCRK